MMFFDFFLLRSGVKMIKKADGVSAIGLVFCFIGRTIPVPFRLMLYEDSVFAKNKCPS